MTVKVGVIGVGVAGSAHVRTLNDWVPAANVVALADIAIDRVRDAAAALPGEVASYDDASTLINDPNVEAIVITSIASTHADLVLRSIAAGKPVFCEKPLAVTAEESRAIVDAEIASGRHLVQVGFMRRFDPSYLTLKDALDRGDIGDVVAVHAAHRNASVPPSFTSEMHTTEALIHEIDVLRWLLDDEYATVYVDGNVTADGALIDPQYARIKTRAGRHIDIEVFVNAGYGYDIRCEVVGRAGTVSLPEVASPVVNRDGRRSVAFDDDFRTRFTDAYRNELVAWIEGIAQGVVAGPTAWDGLVASIVSDAFLRSLRTAEVQPVDLPERPDFY